MPRKVEIPHPCDAVARCAQLPCGGTTGVEHLVLTCSADEADALASVLRAHPALSALTLHGVNRDEAVRAALARGLAGHQIETLHLGIALDEELWARCQSLPRLSELAVLAGGCDAIPDMPHLRVLRVRGVQRLRRVLERVPRLTRLELHGGGWWAKDLENLPALEMLSLHDQPKALSEPTCRHDPMRSLARGLERSAAHLLVLHLEAVGLGRAWDQVAGLARQLARLDQLTTLDLTDNWVGAVPGDAETLLSAAARMPRLETLILRDNVMGGQLTVVECLAIVSRGPALETVDLAKNAFRGMGPDGPAAAAASVLTNVSLATNMLGASPHDGAALGAVARALPRLRALDLGGNEVTRENADNLLGRLAGRAVAVDLTRNPCFERSWASPHAALLVPSPADEPEACDQPPDDLLAMLDGVLDGVLDGGVLDGGALDGGVLDA